MRIQNMILVSTVLTSSQYVFSNSKVVIKGIKECNEKLRLAFIDAAQAKCKHGFDYLRWSESIWMGRKEGEVMAGLSFYCKKDKAYMGLVTIGIKDCHIDRPIFVRTSLVPLEKSI